MGQNDPWRFSRLWGLSRVNPNRILDPEGKAWPWETESINCSFNPPSPTPSPKQNEPEKRSCQTYWGVATEQTCPLSSGVYSAVTTWQPFCLWQATGKLSAIYTLLRGGGGGRDGLGAHSTAAWSAQVRYLSLTLCLFSPLANFAPDDSMGFGAFSLADSVSSHLLLLTLKQLGILELAGTQTLQVQPPASWEVNIENSGAMWRSFPGALRGQTLPSSSSVPPVRMIRKFFLLSGWNPS